MKAISGHDVKIFTDNIEASAIEQIEQLLSIQAFSGCKIRIMPDVHAGAGCVIGFTGNLGDKVIPNIVGVDIGCGILVQPFACTGAIGYHALNEYILHNIPSGRNFRDNRFAPLPQEYMDDYRESKELIKQLRCYRELKETKRLNLSIGSLGGGNHFIEIDVDNEGNHYLIIHSGSRSLGVQVCEIYQKIAVNHTFNQIFNYRLEAQKIIDDCLLHNQENLINDRLQNLKNLAKNIVYPNKDLCYLEGQDLDNYLHDMGIVQKFAARNRQLIAEKIVKFLNCAIVDSFTCIHNYIDLEEKILRKGSIDASLGKRVIIPLNMRDGCILGIGKGIQEYNSSAPHGAGRALSRMNAKDKISLIDFKEEMKNIYSTSVGETTIDEAPQAYKNKNDILKYLPLLVDDIRIIKPLYNFKAH